MGERAADTQRRRFLWPAIPGQLPVEADGPADRICLIRGIECESPVGDCAARLPAGEMRRRKFCGLFAGETGLLYTSQNGTGTLFAAVRNEAGRPR